MSGLANKTEYTYETYGTARATIKLPSGHIEIVAVTSPDEFTTDREITQTEYETIRGCLRQMADCVAMQSDPLGLRIYPSRTHEADDPGHVIEGGNWPYLNLGASK